jgi:hypothetical protein
MGTKQKRISSEPTFQEKNSVLTGDLFVEFNPYRYILVYYYPEQTNQYPNIAQNFQHIIQNREAEGIQKTPPNNPTTSSSSSLLSSPERVVKQLRSRTVTTDIQYAKPKSKSWIKRSLAIVKSHPGMTSGK